jgi:hypothetical protein
VQCFDNFQPDTGAATDDKIILRIHAIPPQLPLFPTAKVLYPLRAK